MYTVRAFSWEIPSEPARLALPAAPLIMKTEGPAKDFVNVVRTPAASGDFAMACCYPNLSSLGGENGWGNGSQGWGWGWRG